jgi:hypothetical protein
MCLGGRQEELARVGGDGGGSGAVVVVDLRVVLRDDDSEGTRLEQSGTKGSSSSPGS